jgi:hypothetical protein
MGLLPGWICLENLPQHLALHSERVIIWVRSIKIAGGKMNTEPNAENLFKVIVNVLETFSGAGGSGDDIIQVIGEINRALLDSKRIIEAMDENEFLHAAFVINEMGEA